MPDPEHPGLYSFFPDPDPEPNQVRSLTEELLPMAQSLGPKKVLTPMLRRLHTLATLLEPCHTPLPVQHLTLCRRPSTNRH